MIYTSPFPSVDIPSTSIFDLIFGGLTDEEASWTAVTEATTDASVTYGELRELAESFAGVLAQRGIGKGDVVSLQIPNTISYVVALLGILRAGAVVSPLGALLNQSDVEKFVSLADAKLYVGTTDLEETPQVFSSEVLTLASGNHPAPAVELAPDDIAAIPFSSGTTGLSKGVVLAHRQITANMAQTKAGLEASGITQRINILSPLPYTHIYGLTTSLLSQLYGRHHIVTLPKFDLPQFIDAHPKYGINLTFMAPPVAVVLTKHPAVTPEKFATTNHIICAAAPLDNQTARMLEERIDVTVFQGYGMTEAAPLTHLGVAGKTEPGSIGYVGPNTQCKLLELDNDNEVPAGETGEIVVKGPQVMVGYLNNPEATAAVLSEDGWLRTGDIARVAEDGAFYIVGRAKEVIKYKGYQVPPAELEALLLTHPEITDCGVVGVMRDGLEIPRAFIVKTEGSLLTAEEIMAWVAERVTPYKKIRAVDFIDEIPKSPTGKIERLKLQEIPLEGESA
ncbi:AMP-binding protein [Corynebacterium liangguodongii]|uniref:Acyl-CoA synthetase n=1 Tax=Corynebacterium liangguodongii TaxID=2079535 RepID=A0A2S0WFH9_9CORY|nr:AMP-binding protein [Corynebacterium liangguodongii]AWB84519.1 acyl-CoA synthetase [Corynebacterium liangguodongii]PWB98897.1 acyl-CoA synthetase [Corynebacterium liangguodongii]